MQRKAYLFFLLALTAFSCEKLELTRSDLRSPTGSDLANRSLRPPPCMLPDATTNAVTINAVYGDTVNYNFRVQNAGAGDLSLSDMSFQTYLSTDNVFDPAIDVPAGGALFSTFGAPVLAPGETYLQGWTYMGSGAISLTDYHFLIIELLAGPSFPGKECSTANNVIVTDIGCNLPEVDIIRVEIDYVEPGNWIMYTARVVNLGWASVDLTDMIAQGWLSTDEFLDAGDRGAGGATFGTSAPTLARGESYHKSLSCDLHAVDITSYNYLIVQVYSISGGIEECNLNNNVRAVPLP